MTVGILGGTGPQGRGLARRLAAAGHQVIIGSRSAERAQQVAAEYAEVGDVSGAGNAEAASADLVIVAVPYAGHAELLESLTSELDGKIVVDCVNPLGFDKQGPFPLPGAGRVRGAGGPADPDRIDGDRRLPSRQRGAAGRPGGGSHRRRRAGARRGPGRGRQVCELATAIPGARGIYAGRLRNAGQIEALTANLIAINRRYKAHSSLMVTDLP